MAGAGPMGDDSGGEVEACGNCGTVLQARWCHVCGQSSRSLVRPLRLVLADAADTLFGYDTRIWRTIPTLVLRPGRLTLDYLAGKRASQVAPFRLFFVASILAFLVLQVLATTSGTGRVGTGNDAFAGLETVEEVERERDALIAQFDALSGQLQDTAPGAQTGGMAQAQRAIDQAANRRIREIRGDRDPDGELGTQSRDTFWNPRDNPIHVAAAPTWLNTSFNRWAERAARNIDLVEQEPGRLIRAFFGLLPAVLFMLMPVFALLLKGLYLRRGQVYMQHLIVGLHSHAFICFAILIAAVLGWAAASAGSTGVVARPLSWLSTAAMVWIPLHLLLSQKRIYGQGWGKTLAKFALIGVLYSTLIVLAILLTITVSLVRL